MPTYYKTTPQYSRQQVLFSPLPLFKRSFIRVVLHVGTVGFDGTITTTFNVLLTVPLRESPFLRSENLLASRELELRTSKGWKEIQGEELFWGKSLITYFKGISVKGVRNLLFPIMIFLTRDLDFGGTLEGGEMGEIFGGTYTLCDGYNILEFINVSSV